MASLSERIRPGFKQQNQGGRKEREKNTDGVEAQLHLWVVKELLFCGFYFPESEMGSVYLVYLTCLRKLNVIYSI